MATALGGLTPEAALRAGAAVLPAVAYMVMFVACWDVAERRMERRGVRTARRMAFRRNIALRAAAAGVALIVAAAGPWWTLSAQWRGTLGVMGLCAVVSAAVPWAARRP